MARTKFISRLVLLIVSFLLITFVLNAQDSRWLRVGQLQSYIFDYGAEHEMKVNSFSWPAQYGDNQHTSRMKHIWLGARNFVDKLENDKLKSVKVVGPGPRYDVNAFPGMVFSRSIKLIARSPKPSVRVDKKPASHNELYDIPDKIDPTLLCDRMVIMKFNTSLGVSVTKKVMAFSQQNHDNYFIYEYTFKNTGIYDAAGNTNQQTLNDFWIHFGYRYAFAGVTSTGWGSTWGAFSSEWGGSTVYHDFGRTFRTLPADGLGTDSLRGFYSYYTPHKDRPVSYEEDWGCPNQLGGGPGVNGVLGSAKFAGAVTLYAPVSVQNSADDPAQPKTTSWYNADDPYIQELPYSQFNETYMQARYQIMSEGHLSQSYAEAVGSQYVSDFYTANRQSGRYGGCQGQGFGPYTLAPNDSIRIVFAEGVSGISWEKCREVGAVWYEYYKKASAPPLVFPLGATGSTHTDYTKAWVFTGKDSILKVFRNARNNYRLGYNIPLPPEPPRSFEVTSGAMINLKWTPPSNTTNLAGYVIYRCADNVKDYRTDYIKVFECNASVTQWDDTSAVSGTKYFYYIQSKDDGSRNDVEPGKPLYSSMFYTMTSEPAFILRAPGNLLGEVRVVPNPFDIRARKWQFADPYTGTTGGIDDLRFWGIPPKCKLRIFTESGTLIWEKNHTDGTGDAKWDSKTSSGQIIVSGIYILHVEVTEDIFATEDKFANYDVTDENLRLIYHKGTLMYKKGEKIFSAGQSTFRKFVVIR